MGQQEEKDIRKVKCFACNELGHYARQCPTRKKGKGNKQVAATAKMDDFATKFEDEFSLFALVTSLSRPTWYEMSLSEGSSSSEQ